MKILKIFKEKQNFEIFGYFYYDSLYKYPYFVIESLFESIKYEIINFFKRIFHILYWFSIIWNNNWWDHHYLEKIIIHQLRYMYKNWDKSHYIGYEKDKNIIKILLNSMERINKDEYDDIFDFSGYKLIFNNIEGEEEFKEIKDSGKILWKDSGKEVKGEELIIPSIMRQRDVELFCNTLKDNLFKLWD